MMKSVNGCIICGSKDTTSCKTVCTPFLAERVWNSEVVRVNLVHCNTCDFTFYNPRPDDKEMERLYKDYRGTEYQKQRERHEKWYTKEVNDSTGHTPAEIKERTANMMDTVKGRVDTGRVRNVLDYGGDSGQFIFDGFGSADRYVYDISNVPLLPGINRISESGERKFDFIMCCHVLEHVPDPHEIINRILKSAHGDTKFYFELPLDRPPLLSPPFINALFRALNSTIAESYFKLVHRPDGAEFCKMHEHINYFSVTSLERLLESHRMNVEHITIREAHMGACSKLLCCCASVGKR